MRFGSTAKVLAECKLEYYRISECIPVRLPAAQANLVGVHSTDRLVVGKDMSLGLRCAPWAERTSASQQGQRLPTLHIDKHDNHGRPVHSRADLYTIPGHAHLWSEVAGDAV